MKKYLFLSLCTLLILTSCGQKVETPSTSTGETTPISKTETTEVVPTPETTSTWEVSVASTGWAKKGDKVAVIYTGTLDDGTMFDASSKNGGKPLEFMVGARQTIPGFDAGVVGMTVGETKKLVLDPKDAYGMYDDKKTKTVKKEVLKDFEEKWGIKLVAGAKLPTQMGVFKIKEVKGDDIIIDLNHEMAGKRLTFEVMMKEIK